MNPIASNLRLFVRNPLKPSWHRPRSEQALVKAPTITGAFNGRWFASGPFLRLPDGGDLHCADGGGGSRLAAAGELRFGRGDDLGALRLGGFLPPRARRMRRAGASRAR